MFIIGSDMLHVVLLSYAILRAEACAHVTHELKRNAEVEKKLSKYCLQRILLEIEKQGNVRSRCVTASSTTLHFLESQDLHTFITVNIGRL